jgi:leucyl aminopeptidase (aminopeptidase T)
MNNREMMGLPRKKKRPESKPNQSKPNQNESKAKNNNRVRSESMQREICWIKTQATQPGKAAQARPRTFTVPAPSAVGDK